jgi:hypothetical protein
MMGGNRAVISRTGSPADHTWNVCLAKRPAKWRGTFIVSVSEGHACRARSEGHVYRARGSGMDNPVWCNGRDKRVPPRSEGHACRARSEGHVYRARGSGMDNPVWCNGRDKRVPPREKSA